MTATASRPPKPLYANISTAVKSPCVSLCRLDDDKFCMGCFRHVEHIREWRSASDERRREICALAAEHRVQNQV